jgi:putative membrane protein
MRARLDEEKIVAAVQRAEARTRGQIVCVLAQKSCDRSGAAALYAGVLACLVPWPLLSATDWSAQLIFALQLAVFLLALLVLGLTPVGVALVPRGERRRQAFRSATEQFCTRVRGRTASRAGVLIFVSLAEHYARIIPDDALAEQVSEAEWREVIEALTAHLRANCVTDGFVAAIDRCGALLERAAPANGDSNELPDGLVRLD